jgi:MFS family permease
VKNKKGDTGSRLADSNPSTGIGNTNSNAAMRVQGFPWGSIIALAMGMLVYGVAESYGPVAAIGNIIPTKYAFLALSLPYIAGGFGSLLSGYLTDSIGRRNSFILTAALILAGVAIYVAAGSNVIALVTSFILIGMAAIGLETPVLSIIAESVPAKWRGNIEVIVQNFGNLGVAIVFIPLLLGFSALQTEVAIVLLFLAPLAALIIGYFMVEESLPWKALAGKADLDVNDAWKSIDGETEPVSPTLSIPLRFLIITIIGIAQDVAFVYITYDVGFLYFSSSLASEIPLIGGLMMVIVGIIFGAAIVHRVSRKAASLASYGLLALLWIILWTYEAITRDISSTTLLALTALLFIPVETTWGVRAMLEPEMFPTQMRGKYVSYVRTLVWIIAGTITGLLSLYVLSFNAEAAIVTAIFITALAMTFLWYLKGFETGKKSLAGHDVTR